MVGRRGEESREEGREGDWPEMVGRRGVEGGREGD